MGEEEEGGGRCVRAHTKIGQDRLSCAHAPFGEQPSEGEDTGPARTRPGNERLIEGASCRLLSGGRPLHAASTRPLLSAPNRACSRASPSDAMSQQPCGGYAFDFRDEGHAAELLDALRQFYTCGLFTDVTLRCGDSGQVFRCHRALLSAHSSYFKVMFTADMKERSRSVIQLSGVAPGVLGALVDYVYTAQVRITEATVQSLLEAADLLQFVSVKRACEEFLIRVLDVDNCLGMHAFAQLHLCSGLEREARRVMLNRLPDLLQQEEFLELDWERMRALLSASVSVQRDGVLVEAVDAWISHDPGERLQRAADLLHSIHMELDAARPRATSEVHGRRLLSTEGPLRPLMSPALRSNGKNLSEDRKVSSSMYVIGGYYWHPLCEVHIWEPVSNTWVQGKDMPDPARESYSVALLGAEIYVTGGYRTNTVDALDTVSVYNCDHDHWTEARPMITARYYHCSVATRGCIYAIGGYSGGAPEKATEFYDPLKKEWFPAAAMVQGMSLEVSDDLMFASWASYCTYECWLKSNFDDP